MKSSEALANELIAAISQLRQIRPEWRLGQTIANLAMAAGRPDAGGVWDLEDQEALAAAKLLVEQYSGSEHATITPPIAPIHRQAPEALQSS